MAWTGAGKTIVALALISALTLPAAASGDDAGSDDDPGSPPGVVYQDEAAEFAHDAALMAEQTGMPADDVDRALSFQDEFTMFGMEVLLPYEDQISAIWVDPAPATRGYVQFVSGVPQQAISEAARRGLDIVFTGGGEISMEEHTLRSELAAEALAAAGYQNFITFSDREKGVIQIELMLPDSAPEPDVADLVELIRGKISTYRAAPDQLSLEGQAAEVRPSDVALTVIRGDGPIVVFD